MAKQIHNTINKNPVGRQCLTKKFTKFHDFENMFRSFDKGPPEGVEFYKFLNVELEYLFIKVIVMEYESLDLDVDT